MRFHLYRMIIEIRDGPLAVEAATIAAALDAKASGQRPATPTTTTTQSHDDADLTSETRHLETVARLFATSPIIQTVRNARAA